MVVMGAAFLLLFQKGGYCIQVILHKITTAGTRSSDGNKKRWLSLTCSDHYIDRFHSSDNTLREDAAYQLVSGIGSTLVTCNTLNENAAYQV